MTVEVSVVVPTFNRLQLLDRCLAGLVAQAFDPSAYEIIIADDAASDRTRHQVEDWRSRCLQTGPTIHYLPVRTRTVRPPPAMPGGDSPRGG